MINRIMKNSGLKAYHNDLEKLDLTNLDDTIREVRDIAYGNDPEQTMDVQYKDIDDKCDAGKGNESKSPILINIHGGGFISGDKNVTRLFSNYMAQCGFVVFDVNYRLAYPKYTVFDQIEDVDHAVRKALAIASDFSGDTDSLYITGHSSGGVLAVAECLLSLDSNMLGTYCFDKRDYSYKGIILDCGLMRFYARNIAYWGMRNMVFPKGYGKDPKYPYLVFEDNKIIRDLPRTVLITNSKDELKDMTYYFKGLLDEKSVPNLLIDSGSDGHMGIVFKPYTQDNQNTLATVTEYLLHS